MYKDEELDTVARMVRSLGDPNRLRIIMVLTMECQSVSAIVAETGLPQPLVSHHLRVLREQGLVRPERRGAYIFYCLSDEAIGEAVESLGHLAGRVRRAGQAESRTAPTTAEEVRWFD
jgi:ArsR family transcriptional regulator